jgi:PEP-CTERM motif
MRAFRPLVASVLAMVTLLVRLPESSAWADTFTSLPISLGVGTVDSSTPVEFVASFKAGDITIPPPGTTLFDLFVQPSDSGTTRVATSANNPNFDDVVAIFLAPFVDSRFHLNGAGIVSDDFFHNSFPEGFAGLTIDSITLRIDQVSFVQSNEPLFPFNALFSGALVVDTVPEPSSLVFLMSGLAVLGLAARRRRD